MYEAPTQAEEIDARTERHRHRLERIAEIGMEMIEALRLEWAEPAPDQPRRSAPEIAQAFAQLARAVSRAAALDARLLRDAKLRALEADRDRWRHEARQGRAAVKAEVRGAVQTLIAKTPAGRKSRDSLERRLHARLDRLDDTADAWLATTPVPEVIARICYDLGLSPDWARLDDDWAQDAQDAFDRISHHKPLVVELVDFDNPDQPGEMIVMRRRPSG